MRAKALKVKKKFLATNRLPRTIKKTIPNDKKAHSGREYRDI